MATPTAPLRIGAVLATAASMMLLDIAGAQLAPAVTASHALAAAERRRALVTTPPPSGGERRVSAVACPASFAGVSAGLPSGAFYCKIMPNCPLHREWRHAA
jgi:hypothetical protein